MSVVKSHKGGIKPVHSAFAGIDQIWYADPTVSSQQKLNVKNRVINRSDYDRGTSTTGLKVGDLGTDLRAQTSSISVDMARLSDTEKWLIVAALTGIIYVWGSKVKIF